MFDKKIRRCARMCNVHLVYVCYIRTALSTVFYAPFFFSAYKNVHVLYTCAVRATTILAYLIGRVTLYRMHICRLWTGT